MNDKNVRYNENKKIRKKSKLTVCIAAIINTNAILGLSDRMITSTDIEFQPPQNKIWGISNSIAMMTAGDLNIQNQLYSKTAKIISEKIDLNPKKWISIEEAANIYKEFYFDLKNSLAKDEILSPYMLDHDKFIERQQTMSRDFIDRIAYKLETFTIENIETIIAGIDETGSHIYSIRNGIISCDDKIGFTAIGIGSNHALSHFMLSEYTRNTILSKAFLIIHQAKKKAEVSPGVGEKTDIFLVGPSLGSLYVSNPDYELQTLKQLDKFYEEYKMEIKKLNEEYEKKIDNYLSELISKQKSVSSTSPSSSPSIEAESDLEQKEDN